MEFKIPYEKMRVNSVIFAEAIREQHQLPYTKALVKDGRYRDWISKMSEESLDAFIQKNEAILKERLEARLKSGDPRWDIYSKFVYRICLYMTEKHLRHDADTSTLDEDLTSYYLNWEGKFKQAHEEWIAELGANAPDEKSDINPYY